MGWIERVGTVAVDGGDFGTTQFKLSQDDQMFLLQNGRAAAAARVHDRLGPAGYENTLHLRFTEAETVPDREPPTPAVSEPVAGPA